MTRTKTKPPAPVVRVGPCAVAQGCPKRCEGWGPHPTYSDVWQTCWCGHSRGVHDVDLPPPPPEREPEPTPVADLREEATQRLADGLDIPRALLGAPPGQWEGVPGRECGEHRPIGLGRSRCLDCHERCSPEILCQGCEVVLLRDIVTATVLLLAEYDAKPILFPVDRLREVLTGVRPTGA